MKKSLQFVSLVIVLFTLTACQTLSIDTSDSIKKSPNDQRLYHSLLLDNKLEVLLISDPTTDKAAASLDVKVGSSSDPKNYQGLAHFLEHMLFLGTEAYPEPDAYQKYISEHGGYHNAYTSLEHTNYFFDIQSDALNEALKRFSSQFTTPLFNAEYVEREVNAVHSEYTSKVKDDGRRFFSVLKEQLAPNHPFANFSVGNKKTLTHSGNDALRNALLEFYSKHYSANQMKLVILGKESLNELELMARSLFSDIPNSNIPTKTISQAFFAPDFLPAELRVQNIKDTRSLSVAFPIPSSFKYQQEKPTSYLANLIGHEGHGSLLSLLKTQGLADSLSAGSQFDTRHHEMFLLRLGLTQKGLDNYEDILIALFSYIELLKQKGMKELYFNEQAQMLDIAFRFQEKSDPGHYVSALSSQLHDSSYKNVLYRPYDLSKFDKALYRSYLDYLNPKNMLVTITSKNQKGDKHSEWYKAEYAITPIKQPLVDKLTEPEIIASLTLPEENIFIPNEVEFVNTSNVASPKLSLKEDGIELWSYPNNEFNTPKSNLFITLRSPVANITARNLNQTELLTQLLKDQLNEYSYPAYLAGLNYELYNHMRGITLKISGYSNKQHVLLKEIIETIKTARFEEDRFEIKKEKLSRKLSNAKSNKPFQQALSKLQNFLINPSWDEDERLVALEELSVSDLNRYRDEFLASIDIAILNSGNISSEGNIAFTNLIKQSLLINADHTKVERAKITRLEDGVANEFAFPVDHNDTGFALYFQGRNKSFNERAKFLLLSQLLSSDYYNTIRTEKQLGYIVFATDFSLLQTPGIAFIVQSPDASSKDIFKESQSFLEELSNKEEVWNEESFIRNKQAVLTKLLKKDNTLYERTNRFWGELDAENLEFDTNRKLADEIKSLQIEDIIPLLKELSKSNSRTLLIHTHSLKNKKNKQVMDLPEFKNLKSLSAADSRQFFQ